MPHDILLLILPILALAVAAQAQAVYYRLRKSMSRSHLAALAAGAVSLGVASAWLRGPDPVEDMALAVLNFGTFLGLWLCFVAVVGLGLSLRMRIMDFLMRSGRPQPEAVIEEHFGASAQVRRRLDGMLKAGHIAERDGRLVSTGSWLTRIALLNAAIKHFLTGRASEFAPEQEPDRGGRQ